MPPQTPAEHSHPGQTRSNETLTGQAQIPPPDWQDSAAQPPRRPMSRRSILRVSAVGAAAAAVGAGSVVAFDRRSGQPATPAPVSKPVAMAPMAPTAMAGPLVVYISDTTNGLLDVFGGTGQTRIHNPALVSELLANLKLA